MDELAQGRFDFDLLDCGAEPRSGALTCGLALGKSMGCAAAGAPCGMNPGEGIGGISARPGCVAAGAMRGDSGIAASSWAFHGVAWVGSP